MFLSSLCVDKLYLTLERAGRVSPIDKVNRPVLFYLYIILPKFSRGFVWCDRRKLLFRVGNTRLWFTQRLNLLRQVVASYINWKTCSHSASYLWRTIDIKNKITLHYDVHKKLVFYKKRNILQNFLLFQFYPTTVKSKRKAIVLAVIIIIIITINLWKCREAKPVRCELN